MIKVQANQIITSLEMAASQQKEFIFNCVQYWPYTLHALRDTFPAPVKEKYAQELTDLVSDGNFDKGNLFFSGLTTESGHWLCGLHKLTWDTDFFGFGIARLEPFIHPHIYSFNESALETGLRLVNNTILLAKQNRIDQIIAIVDPSDSFSQWCLEKAGFFLKDTIVCYRLNLSKFQVNKEAVQNVRQATSKDAEQLSSISATCFGQRQYNINRFNSDLQYNPVKASQMYGLWASKSVQGILADTVFVIDDNDGPSGFITVKLPKELPAQTQLKLGTIPLNAVFPGKQKQGVYTRLVQKALLWLQDNGADWVEIRTQLPNAGVHKVWQRLGAEIALCHHTFHLNLTR